VTGVSPALQALYEGDRESGERLLGEPIDVFEAAAFGRLEELRSLLESEPDLATAYSSDGFTALHLAAFFAQPQAAALLLQRGADASAVARNAMRVEPLHSAAAARQTDVARMLLAAGADPNARQEGGFVALHAAAQNGDEELARLLLEHGADRTLAADDGRTSAGIAREAGHSALADSLA
jgi:ankyrin repeat protein